MTAAKGIAVELCAGLGGIGIGLRALGFHIAKAYDSWQEAVARRTNSTDRRNKVAPIGVNPNPPLPRQEQRPYPSTGDVNEAASRVAGPGFALSSETDPALC